MAIVMKPAVGLAKRLRDNGLGLIVEFSEGGGQITSTPDDLAAQAVIDAYTVADEQDYLCAEVSAMAKQLRDRAVADVSAGEMASWPVKRAEAAAYLASRNPGDAPMLSVECAARGISLDAMVAKVEGNAARLAQLEAIIAGVDGRHRDALRACNTFEALAAYDYTTGWPSP